jgi:hypothetical protein
MGVFSTAAELCRRCVSLAGTSKNRRDEAVTASNPGEPFQSQGRGGSDDDARKRTLFVYGQSLWMAVTLALLLSLNLWSLRLYIIVSVIGLLINRLLFAPARKTERWWRVASAVTWVCFAGLCYLVFLRMQAVTP